MNTDLLISGYTAYTTAEEFGATAEGDAPGTTPVVTFFGVSTATCGAGFSAATAASVAATYHVGC